MAIMEQVTFARTRTQGQMPVGAEAASGGIRAYSIHRGGIRMRSVLCGVAFRDSIALAKKRHVPGLR